MSFDQYFEDSEADWLGSNSVDDWYRIVEEALYTAELQPRRQGGQLELSLMKPLPMIPEDTFEESPMVLPIDAAIPRRPSSVYSSDADFSHWPNPHTVEIYVPENNKEHAFQSTDECAIVRRPSSVYSTDFDSPESLESSALNDWASDICVVSDNSSMRSLRKKPFERTSSDVRSSGSDWSTSMGSSDLERRSKTSSIYSVDSSVYSYNSHVKSACMHARNVSDGSAISSKKVRFEETAMVSFFDLSDNDEDENSKDDSEGSGHARVKSYSASKCLKAGRQLGKKAFSLRIATSPKATQTHAKAASMPSSDVPALSAWLFRSSLLDRISTSPTSPEAGLEGQLMAGAAKSAKARRILGLE